MLGRDLVGRTNPINARIVDPTVQPAGRYCGITGGLMSLHIRNITDQSHDLITGISAKVIERLRVQIHCHDPIASLDQPAGDPEPYALCSTRHDHYHQGSPTIVLKL
jgi:hypothetical protein